MVPPRVGTLRMSRVPGHGGADRSKRRAARSCRDIDQEQRAVSKPSSPCLHRARHTQSSGRTSVSGAGSAPRATDRASAAIDWRLFLPASWDPAAPRADADKAARRTRCGIPARVGHVEKWQPAPDMIDETLSWGIDIPLVVADAGYGDAAAFRLGLEERGLPCAVGISDRHTAHPAEAQPVQPACADTGRPLKMQYPEPAQTMKDLVIAAGKAAARPLSWREGSRPGKGHSGVKRMYSRFATLRLRPAGRGVRKAADDPELPERWLPAERPTGESEPVQFWLSSLPSGMPLATVVRLAKLRWSSEHDYREMKQALGLAHFEGRTWGGWHHHGTLVSAARAFCTLQRLAHDPKDPAQA